MKSSKILLSLFSMLILVFLFACSNTKVKPISKGQIKNVSFEYEIQFDNSIKTTIKYWIKDSKMKIETKSGKIYYFDSKNNTTYTYNPNSNIAIKSPEPQAMNGKDIPPRVEDIPNDPFNDYFENYDRIVSVNHSGTSDIGEDTCFIYDLSTDSFTDKYYISKKNGYPIKWETISVGFTSLKATKIVTIKNLKINNVTDDDVSLPVTAQIK